MPSAEFSKAEARYEWRCRQCGAIHVEKRRMRPGDAMWQPTIPAGWLSVGGEFYCPNHRVQLLIDGQVEPLPAGAERLQLIMPNAV